MLKFEEPFYFHTQNGPDILFGLARFSDGYRIYHLSAINYWGRSDSLQDTCRSWDPVNCLYFINWYPAPLTLESAEAVAAAWACLTVTYILTGEPLEAQYRRLHGGNQG